MIDLAMGQDSTDLEARRQEHEDRLTVMALEDEAAARREAAITVELERIREGESLRDAAILLAEHREIQQRRQDRRVSRALTEAARERVDVEIAAAELEGVVSQVEAQLRARAEDMRRALDELVPPIQALFATTETHKILQARVIRFRGEHGRGPSLVSVPKLTGLHPSELGALRIILTNHEARGRAFR